MNEVLEMWHDREPESRNNVSNPLICWKAESAVEASRSGWRVELRKLKVEWEEIAKRLDRSAIGFATELGLQKMVQTVGLMMTDDFNHGASQTRQRVSFQLVDELPSCSCRSIERHEQLDSNP
jgi:hypothetical protein